MRKFWGALIILAYAHSGYRAISILWAAAEPGLSLITAIAYFCAACLIVDAYFDRKATDD